MITVGRTRNREAAADAGGVTGDRDTFDMAEFSFMAFRARWVT